MLKVRSQRAEAKRQEIIEAAKKILQEKGYHGTSMRDIAEAVGLVKASLYQHITSKEDMVCEIMLEGVREFAANLEQACTQSSTYTEKLRSAIHYHTRHTVLNTDVLAVLLENTKHLSEGQRAKVIDEQHRIEKIFTDILEGGIRAGEFRPVDVKVAAFAILGMCNWMYRWYSEKGSRSQEAIADIFYSLTIQGLRNSDLS